MTKEGRLTRGKANLEYKNLDGTIGRFLDNTETLEYIAEKPKLEAAAKEAEKEKEKKLQKEAEARAKAISKGATNAAPTK